MLKRVLCLVILPVLGFLWACSSWTVDDRREGFLKGTLRIYVRLEVRDGSDKQPTDEELKKELSDRAKKRCAEMLYSAIRMERRDRRKEKELTGMIGAVMEKPSLVYYRDRDDYVEAFFDFPAKDLSKELGGDYGTER